MSHRPLRLLALTLGSLLALGLAAPAGAQGPTPEGTVLTAQTSASWTDANGNTYTPVTAAVSITVGHLPGIDITGPLTATPASPSTGSRMAFTVTNTGNGVDTVDFDPGSLVHDMPFLTITGYEVNGTPVGTEASALDGALAAISLDPGESLDLAVLFDIASRSGEQTGELTLHLLSLRDNDGASDSHTVAFEIPALRGVSATSAVGAINRLPSNATTYSAQFTVENLGNTIDTYDLAVSSSDPGVTVVSVNGTAGSAGSILMEQDGDVTFTVVYSVGDVAAGTVGTLTLTATSQDDVASTASATHTVTVIRAGLSITKALHGETLGERDALALAPEDVVLPGAHLWIRVMATNSGAAPAGSVEITESLPEGTTHTGIYPDGGGWTYSFSGAGGGAGVVTATLTAPLAAGASRHIWIRVQVQ